MIHLALVDEKSSRDVFVSPQGRLLGCIDPESRLIAWDRKIHGELLSGKWGERLVELVGSWAIVMVLSGLYLWWPVKDGTSTLAGVVWPRLSRGRQAMWRDLHAVTGFWVSGLALVLLITALPWAGVWGDSFKLARRELGWGSERPDWKIGGGDTDMSVGHDHYAMIAPQERGIPLTSLAGIVASAKAQSLAFPVMIKPPGTPDRTGDTNGVWTVKSEAQNRPLTVTITYDLMTGKELSRRAFADKHPIDQAIGYGITWHEGQLFGWINQLVGLLTTVALVALVISGFILWRRRRPQGQLGAPRTSHVPARMGGVVAIMLVLAALLPMLALSLFGLWIFDWLILPRAPRLAAWLG